MRERERSTRMTEHSRFGGKIVNRSKCIKTIHFSSCHSSLFPFIPCSFSQTLLSDRSTDLWSESEMGRRRRVGAEWMNACIIAWRANFGVNYSIKQMNKCPNGWSGWMNNCMMLKWMDLVIDRFTITIMNMQQTRKLLVVCIPLEFPCLHAFLKLFCFGIVRDHTKEWMDQHHDERMVQETVWSENCFETIFVCSSWCFEWFMMTRTFETQNLSHSMLLKLWMFVRVEVTEQYIMKHRRWMVKRLSILQKEVSSAFGLVIIFLIYECICSRMTIFWFSKRSTRPRTFQWKKVANKMTIEHEKVCFRSDLLYSDQSDNLYCMSAVFCTFLLMISC